jgi:hypothetical protein
LKTTKPRMSRDKPATKQNLTKSTTNMKTNHRQKYCNVNH